MSKNNLARTSKKQVSLLNRVDVTKLGSADDPCFGKLYDLTSDECQICGDSEYCCIAFAEFLKQARKETAEGTAFKDVEEVVVLSTKDQILQYIRALIRAKASEVAIRVKTKRKFNLTKEQISNYLKMI